MSAIVYWLVYALGIVVYSLLFLVVCVVAVVALALAILGAALYAVWDFIVSAVRWHD